MSGTKSKASATKETTESFTRKRFTDRGAKTADGADLAKQAGDARVQRARRQSHNQVQSDGSRRSEGRPKKAVRLGVSGTFSDLGGEQHPE